MDGKISRKTHGNLLHVMNTPVVFSLVGMERLPIEIRVDNMHKILLRKHHISPDILKQIPQALADPVMIFKSEHDLSRNRDSRIVFTELREKDNNGNERPVMAAITLGKNNLSKGYAINELTTVHKKDTSSKQNLTPKEDIYDWITRTFKDGSPMNLLLYVNKQKARQGAISSGFRPIVFDTLDKLPESIPDEQDLARLNAQNDGYDAETYYQIGAKRKHDMDIALSRHRPDMTPQQRADAISEIEKLGESVRQGGNPKVEKIAIHWLLGGHIILPEDNYKILDAIRISEQEHFDPMRFDDPNEILAKYTIRETTAERRINPDTVPEFSNKINYDNGITVYTVDDTEEGQAAVRSIIDTHWGEDANPWCLAARTENQNFDEDEYEYEDEREPDLRRAWEYWSNTYNTVDKRIAFRNGKLLAFCASDDGNNTWWDREDEAHEGIPYTLKEHGNTIVYGYNETTGQSIKTKETLTNGTERTWYSNGQLESEALPDGTTRTWGENGQLNSERLADGTKYFYYESGKLKRRTLPDGTSHEFYRDSQLRLERLPDGTQRSWHENGHLWEEHLPDGTVRQYYENGTLESEKLPDGTARTYDNYGNLTFELLAEGTRREFYRNGQLRLERLPDGTEHLYNTDGQLKSEILPDGTKRNYRKNGQLFSELLLNWETRYYDENGQLINSGETYSQTANNIQNANNYFNNYRKEHPDKFITPDALAQMERYDQLVTHATGNIIWNNRFDLRFVGSSEGSAAFGYGAYFAENPATSESYRHEGDPNLGKFGISVTTKDGSHFSSNLRGRTPMDYVLSELLMRFWDTKSEITPADVKAAKDDMLQSAQKLLKERKHTLADYKRNPQNYGRFFSEDAERETIKNLTEEIDALKSIADISLIPPKKGNVYLFDIPENNVLMDWDAHMTQQSDNVKAARKAIIQELKDAGIDTAKLKRAKTGENFYRALTKALQGYSIDGITDSQQKASYMLNKHGVPGHRFLDRGSRDTGKGTHNFVIWNTKTITMLGVEGNPEAVEHFRNTALQKLTGNPNETYNQFIGKKGMDRLAIDGRFSALGTADTLENAKQLDAKHMPVSFIWKSTGWIKGKDGEWRTEIPDGKLSDAFMNNPKRRNVTLKDVFDNNILYSAYPDLVSMKITIKPMKGSTRAYYSPSTKSITINRNSMKKGELSEVRLDIIHEIQHAIQDIEGFATGSSSDKKEETKLRRKINKLLQHPDKDINKQLYIVDLTWAFIDKNNPKDVALLNKRVAGLTPEARAVWQEIQELRSMLPDAQRQDLENYKRSAGEVEARNSETRADFDTDRRRNTPPTLSEDTPRSKQILNRYGNNSSFLTPEKYDQLMHHGSKNILLGNRFDLRWLSSGEGHQAFGYGAYLAEEIRVSQTYRKAGMSQLDTADTVFIMKDGRQKAPNEIIAQLSNITDKLKKHDVFKDKAGKISWDFEKYIESHIPAMRIGVLLQDLAHGMNSDKYSSIGEVIDYSINKMLDEVHEDINHGKYAPRKFLEMWNNGGEKLFRELIAPLMPAEVKAKSPSKGNVYLFDGPENDELLDWDAPMSEQPKNVLDALKKGGLFISNHETGEQLYRRLSKQLGSDILASMKLNELGIPGHRFWDELSRLTKSGTHNFVIWNTDTLRLLGLTDDSDNDAQDYYRAEDYSRAYLDSLDNNSDIIDYSDRDYDYDTAHIDDLAEAQSDALDNSPETFYQQVRLWQDTVDAVLRNDINPDAFLKVINPPDVLRLIGLNPKPLYMNAAKILRIRADHKTIFRDILGQIPYAISDPVAIFNDNRDGHRNIMIMTDIIDMYGNSVVVPVNLAYPAGKRIVTRLATVYSVGRHNRLAKLFEQGNILYLNRQKAAEWENRTGRKLPLDNINAPFNENDLAAFTPQNEKRRPYRKFPSVIQINARQNNNSTAETYSQSANDNLMDSNIVRSAEDFLTHEARQQVDALRRKYQGTSMWLKAPNGNDTKLSELQWLLVRTDNFKAWFGDWENDPDNSSQVVDENGEPLVVYHGSEREDFSIFDTKGKNHSKGAGSFFSDSKDVAETFVSGKLSEDKIFPVFLNIRNPYIIGGSNNFWSTIYKYHVYDNIRKRNIFLKNNGSNFQSKDDTEQYISNVLNDPEHKRYTVKESYCMTTDDIARFAWNFRKGNKKRFDGVIIRNVYDIGYPNINGINPISDEFIIPKPNQIKSATRNNGQYSTHNQEIYKQSIGEYGAKAIDNANGNSALMDNLRMAQEMHRRGIKPRTSEHTLCFKKRGLPASPKTALFPHIGYSVLHPLHRRYFPDDLR